MLVFDNTLIISTYTSAKMSVCLSVSSRFSRPFGNRFGNPLYTVAYRHRMSSKTIKFQKKLFSAELLPFFYISLRFLCKFEERL